MTGLAGERPLIAVVGPTAVGKTAVGIALAQQLNGEIISADAVAVYRQLDIGAAKPDAAEQSQAVFHLIDIADPEYDYTVTEFERDAEAAMAAIRAQNRTPLLVGGTGLYVRAVTATLTVPNVPPQTELRERLWAEVEQTGAPALHAKLAEVDPAAAAKILPGDGKRIIRALEVYEVTGRPMSSYHTPEGVRGVPKPNIVQFGLTMERETLYRRIETRVDAMMAAGFLDEVRALLAAGYGPELKSMQSLGYRHLLQHLTDGADLDEMVTLLKRDTRRFARRQLMWFRADPNVRWTDITEAESAETAAEMLVQTLAGLPRGQDAGANPSINAMREGNE